MNILVIAHYQGDGSPSAIFVHEQNKRFVKAGNRVLVISPIAVGKKNKYGKSRCCSEHAVVECVVYIFLHSLSFSRFGEDKLNAKNAIGAINKKIYGNILDFKPDIIHAHTLGIDSEIGTYLKKKLGIPLVITTHGSDLEVPIRKRKTDRIKMLIQGANRTIAISRKLENEVRMICPRASVTTIMNGCNTERCSTSLKKRLSFVFVGNLIPQKNTDIVIKAFAMLKKNYPQATLTIIGDGIEKKNLKHLCDELAIRDDVSFVGYISNDEVIDYMSVSEYFIMPSVNEGFGIVYIEAMACGCITIGTEGEGIDGFIINGKNGFLCKPEEKEIYQIVLNCEKDEYMKKMISKTGYQDAHLMTWEKNVFENIRVFEGVLKNENKK